MKPLFSQEEYLNSNVRDMLPCLCYVCNKPFLKQKRSINKILNSNKDGHSGKYCSSECLAKDRTFKQSLECTNCQKQIIKQLNEIKKNKNLFCSKNCSAIYNNKNKKFGYKKSKLEIWIKEQLSNKYPNINIIYNDVKTISMELDIYIPFYNLAFEINGIHHYNPIYGEEKFKKIQNNDTKKKILCKYNNIELYVINITSQKYFKPSTSTKFLNTIIDIIEKKRVIGLEPTTTSLEG